jgi:hypothetical protein
MACVWCEEVSGGSPFIEEEVAERAPNGGGVAAHVGAPLPLKICGSKPCFNPKQSEWNFGGLGRWKRERLVERVGGDVMYAR